MYVINDIAYSQVPNECLKITEARAIGEYLLWVKFNIGEIRIFDFKSLLDKPAFAPLQEKKVFEAVTIEHGCPIWLNGEIDIAPEYLYEYGTVA